MVCQEGDVRQGLALVHVLDQERPEAKRQEWQKGLGLPAKKGTTPTEHKKAKATMAARMFPLKVDKLWGPRGGAIDGLADALMIADWLRRNG